MQHLDLSNCCLTRVPPVLARLPHLTNLTLNENDALGGSAAALAPLSTLTNLRVGGWVAHGLRARALSQVLAVLQLLRDGLLESSQICQMDYAEWRLSSASWLPCLPHGS